MTKSLKDSEKDLPELLQTRIKLLKQKEQENPEGYGESLSYQGLKRHVERELLALKGEPIPEELMDPSEQSEGDVYQIGLSVSPSNPSEDDTPS